MKRISAKIKPVFNDIPLVRAVCLRNHITDVDIVLAIMILNTGEKRYTLENAIFTMIHKQYNEKEVNEIIADYELSRYCNFALSFADMKARQNEPYFNEFCYVHEINANYIKSNEVI